MDLEQGPPSQPDLADKSNRAQSEKHFSRSNMSSYFLTNVKPVFVGNVSANAPIMVPMGKCNKALVEVVFAGEDAGNGVSLQQSNDGSSFSPFRSTHDDGRSEYFIEAQVEQNYLQVTPTADAAIVVKLGNCRCKTVDQLYRIDYATSCPETCDEAEANNGGTDPGGGGGVTGPNLMCLMAESALCPGQAIISLSWGTGATAKSISGNFTTAAEVQAALIAAGCPADIVVSWDMTIGLFSIKSATTELYAEGDRLTVVCGDPDGGGGGGETSLEANNDGPFAAMQGVEASASILVNDDNPEGTAIKVTSFINNGNVPQDGSTVQVVDADGNTWTVDCDGNVTFTSAANFTGTATAPYGITDAEGDNSGAVVQFTVGSSVVANDDGVFPAVAGEASAAQMLLPNDSTTNPSGNLTVIEFGGVAVPATGSVTVPTAQGDYVVSADGTVVFAPNVNFVGTTTPVEYVAQDDSGAQDNAVVTFEVSTCCKVNLTGDCSNATGVADITNFQLPGLPVVAGPFADEADFVAQLQAATPAYPIIGASFDAATGDLQLQMTAACPTGTASFDCASSVVANDDGTFNAVVGQPITVTPLDNDINPEGTGLGQITQIGGLPITPGQTINLSGVGDVMLAADGVTVTYTPAAGVSGATVIGYQVTDDDGDSDNAVINYVVADCEPVTVGDVTADKTAGTYNVPFTSGPSGGTYQVIDAGTLAPISPAPNVSGDTGSALTVDRNAWVSDNGPATDWVLRVEDTCTGTPVDVPLPRIQACGKVRQSAGFMSVELSGTTATWTDPATGARVTANLSYQPPSSAVATSLLISDGSEPELDITFNAPDFSGVATPDSRCEPDFYFLQIFHRDWDVQGNTITGVSAGAVDGLANVPGWHNWENPGGTPVNSEPFTVPIPAGVIVWASGTTVATGGRYLASNNTIYEAQANGVSTVEPTHGTSTQSGADGIPWTGVSPNENLNVAYDWTGAQHTVTYSWVPPDASVSFPINGNDGHNTQRDATTVQVAIGVRTPVLCTDGVWVDANGDTVAASSVEDIQNL